MKRIFGIITALILSVSLFIGCKSTEKSTEERADTSEPTEVTAGSELADLLDNTRSQLGDVYLTQTQDIPALYLKKDTASEQISRNPYNGFRVQILSTRKVEAADSVANSFRIWADSTIAGYSANAYVSFRQPYYKVHIGDFHLRDHANTFSRLIKSRYPDAWVVHDRIEPSEVPADTATFEFQKPDSSKTDSLSGQTNY